MQTGWSMGLIRCRGAAPLVDLAQLEVAWLVGGQHLLKGRVPDTPALDHAAQKLLLLLWRTAKVLLHSGTGASLQSKRHAADVEDPKGSLLITPLASIMLRNCS